MGGQEDGGTEDTLPFAESSGSATIAACHRREKRAKTVFEMRSRVKSISSFLAADCCARVIAGDTDQRARHSLARLWRLEISKKNHARV